MPLRGLGQTHGPVRQDLVQPRFNNFCASPLFRCATCTSSEVLRGLWKPCKEVPRPNMSNLGSIYRVIYTYIQICVCGFQRNIGIFFAYIYIYTRKKWHVDGLNVCPLQVWAAQRILAERWDAPWLHLEFDQGTKGPIKKYCRFHSPCRKDMSVTAYAESCPG